MKIISNTILSTMILGLLALSCSSSSTTDTPSTSKLSIVVGQFSSVGNYQYEGWILDADKKTVTNTGIIDITKGTTAQTFDVDAAKLKTSIGFAVSIEEKTGKIHASPSSTVILRGTFDSYGITTLTSNIAVSAFSAENTAGKYVLATPTSTVTTDEDSGVWFMEKATPPVAGLKLPRLQGGWAYEGWVVFPGKTPISTGTFTSPSSADSDAANSPYKGADGNGPGYPGGDFVTGTTQDLNFPVTLKGATIVISVEPIPDTDPAPSTLKPLKKVIPTDAATDTQLTMDAVDLVSVSVAGMVVTKNTK